VEKMLVDASLALGCLLVKFLNLQPSGYLVSDWLDVLDSASEGKRLNLNIQI
jgi:hypothetical protein